MKKELHVDRLIADNQESANWQTPVGATWNFYSAASRTPALQSILSSYPSHSQLVIIFPKCWVILMELNELPESWLDRSREGTVRIALDEIVSILRNPSRELDWDDIIDVLDLIGPSYIDKISSLESLVVDGSASYTAKWFALSAISLIDPCLVNSLDYFLVAAKDEDGFVRAKALEIVISSDIVFTPNVISVLVNALADFRLPAITQCKISWVLIRRFGLVKFIQFLVQRKNE